MDRADSRTPVKRRWRGPAGPVPASWLVCFLAACLGLPGQALGFHCGKFVAAGMFRTTEIRECSGLAASRKNPGILWTHNDSGDAPRVFAVRTDGTLRGTYLLEGVRAVDWEDIAVGPCRSGSARQCLYIGDIGDNDAIRPSIQVYRVPEPRVPATGIPAKESLHGADRFDYRYPDGPHDAEALVVDPATGIPCVVTKEELGRTSAYAAFRLPAAGETAVMEKVATLTLRAWITAGDAAPDGSMIILRDYQSAYVYCRPPGSPFLAAFTASPQTIPLVHELQGESLAVGPKGATIYTASEGLNAVIHRAACSGP